MSFIQNEENYKSIIYSAFPKLAQQAAPAPAPVAAVDPSIAQRLAERLNSELSPGAADKFTPNKPGQEAADLKYDDLKFNNLLNFLVTNQIKFSNFSVGTKERIVLTKDEFNQAQNKEDYDIVGAYYVNPEALIEYIQYLQGKLQGQNPLVNARLKLLVDEVNAHFPDAKISRTPQAKEEVAEFKDTDQLDNIQPLFSPKYGVKDGTVPLTIGDLKNREALNAWLQDHQAQVVTYDDKGMAHEQYYLKIKDIQGAIQTVLDSLYDRAKNLIASARSVDFTKKYNYYLSLLSKLGAKGGAGGGGAGNSGPTQQAGYSTSGGMQQENFENIISSLPLGNDIDLRRIQSFFDTVKANYKDPRSSAVVNSYISTAENAMNNLQGITNNLYIVPENTLPKDFAEMLKGSTANYGPAINLLYVILNNTRQVIATIASVYPPIAQSQQLKDQINFYYGRNRAFLNELLRDANQILTR